VLLICQLDDPSQLLVSDEWPASVQVSDHGNAQPLSSFGHCRFGCLFANNETVGFDEGPQQGKRVSG